MHFFNDFPLRSLAFSETMEEIIYIGLKNKVHKNTIHQGIYSKAIQLFGQVMGHVPCHVRLPFY